MGGLGSGRRTKLQERHDTIEILRSSAPRCAEYLRDVVLKKVKKPSWARIRVAEYVIDHMIGKPPQRHELTGAEGQPLTLLQLGIAAENVALVKGGTTQPIPLKEGETAKET